MDKREELFGAILDNEVVPIFTKFKKLVKECGYTLEILTVEEEILIYIREGNAKRRYKALRKSKSNPTE